jgi:O-antigen ligase
MTYSGEQLLVWCSAVPVITLLGERWIVPLSVIGAGIILSFTRSAWLGSAAGLMAIAVAMPRRLLLSVVLPVGLVGLGASSLIYHRLSKSMEPGFAPDTGRIALLKAGAQMIQDHPFFGVGPERVQVEFPRYAGAIDISSFYHGHLENNFMQIAAERGLVCFTAFIWFLVELYAALLKLLKSDGIVRISALSALAALTGFLVAGLFSYDFGDSEVLMLFLFIVSIPFGLSHGLASPKFTDDHEPPLMTSSS